jgi:hypothetical protein
MIHRPLFCLLLLTAANAFSQSTHGVGAVEGYVTRVVSLHDFDANGFQVLTNDKTKFLTQGIEGARRATDVDPYLGQGVTIYGTLKMNPHRVVAKEVVFLPLDNSTISGLAVIDRMPSPSPSPGDSILTVRADGYNVLINADTEKTFRKPLASITDVKTNVWIKYHGKLQSDGVLVADTALFIPNTVVEKESKLLEKNQYDPKAVDPESKQSITSKFVHGRDPKKIPPYEDATMQVRVDRVGASVIPAYQRELAPTDPTKVTFRFQLIDDPKMHDALALPSGIILVPVQIVDYLQNDTHLATVLADRIAAVLEKQTYREKLGKSTVRYTEIASLAGTLPIIAATTAAGSVFSTVTRQMEEEQSGRVSLGLLRDAGYDIRQAPIAWWLLATDAADKIPSTPIPPRASNLYKSLGSTWRNDSGAKLP